MLLHIGMQPGLHAAHQAVQNLPRHIMQGFTHTLLQLFKGFATCCIHFGLSPSPQILNGDHIWTVSKPGKQQRHSHARVSQVPGLVSLSNSIVAGVVVLLEFPVGDPHIPEHLASLCQQGFLQYLHVVTLGYVPGSLALHIEVLGLVFACSNHKVQHGDANLGGACMNMCCHRVVHILHPGLVVLVNPIAKLLLGAKIPEQGLLFVSKHHCGPHGGMVVLGKLDALNLATLPNMVATMPARDAPQ